MQISQYEGRPARREKVSAGKSKGGLVGSGLTMDKAVKNAVSMLGVSIFQAVARASSNPAKVLNLNRNKGLIEKDMMRI